MFRVYPRWNFHQYFEFQCSCKDVLSLNNHLNYSEQNTTFNNNKISFALYSDKAKETMKLIDNGYKISDGDNDNGADIHININREDCKDIRFDALYNKKEIEDMTSW